MIGETHQRKPWFWLATMASALVLLAILSLSYQMLSRGLSLFWPAEVVQFQHTEQNKLVIGQVVAKQQLTAQQLVAAQLDLPAPAMRILLQQGYQGSHEPTFQWYWTAHLSDRQTPEDVVLLRHRSLGNLYGRIVANVDEQVQLRLANGQLLQLNAADILLELAPNAMTLFEKVRWYFWQWWQFLSTEPRDTNSAGGIFPAIVGTLVSVLLMAILVAPIGILAGIYLHEYARNGRLVRLVRLSVHNLAGVPSVVFGVFGLGFFVYVLGGSLDQLLYSGQLPQPTFGTPGLIWVSLTLALLTLPVVIVATEQGLARIPASLRLGGYALGATQAEVLRKLILPAARPAMLTGIVLAVSRAAGEVAPLIFVGVVKYAPVLPVSNTAPYIQFDQQIMSLGFQIYDVGLQSSNADAAEPRVFAIALVLLALIGSLNLLVMRLRHYYQYRQQS